MRLGAHPGYVLDEMQPYEITALAKHSYYAERGAWERARFIATVTARALGAKVEYDTLIKFPWEKEVEETGSTTMSNSDRERLEAQAQAYLNSKK